MATIDKAALLAKAQAKLAAQKATTLDDPVLVPGTYPPELRTPVIKTQDTKGNPMGVLTRGTEANFWCAMPSHTAHLKNAAEAKFVNHRVRLTRTEEIAQLRQLCKLYPSKFKEI